MKKKGLVTMALTICLTLVSAFISFAGEWRQDDVGWWWQEDDGSYPVNVWRWLDGNNDGIYEQYHFNTSGYLDVNTALDEWSVVNADGARLGLDGKMEIMRNGPSADKQTKFLFSVEDKDSLDVDSFWDNARFMSEYPDLKSGVCRVWETDDDFTASFIELRCLTDRIMNGGWYIIVKETDDYEEINLFADEAAQIPVGKYVKFKKGETNYIRMFGYY